LTRLNNFGVLAEIISHIQFVLFLAVFRIGIIAIHLGLPVLKIWLIFSFTP